MVFLCQIRKKWGASDTNSVSFPAETTATVLTYYLEFQSKCKRERERRGEREERKERERDGERKKERKKRERGREKETQSCS